MPGLEFLEVLGTAESPFVVLWETLTVSVDSGWPNLAILLSYQ